jgi:acetolactate synthase I/II/III large subunit
VFKEVRHLILVGASAPVAFFGYPGKPSALTPPGCDIQTLAAPHEDLTGALAALAEAIRAPQATTWPAAEAPPIPNGGAITPGAIAAMPGALLPEGAIVCDESLTTGQRFFPMSRVRSSSR